MTSLRVIPGFLVYFQSKSRPTITYPARNSPIFPSFAQKNNGISETRLYGFSFKTAMGYAILVVIIRPQQVFKPFNETFI